MSYWNSLSSLKHRLLASPNVSPYTASIQALQVQHGQRHQLTQSEIAALLMAQDVKVGDSQGFQSFALQSNMLTSRWTSLEDHSGYKLNYCFHVDRLLSKLPKCPRLLHRVPTAQG